MCVCVIINTIHIVQQVGIYNSCHDNGHSNRLTPQTLFRLLFLQDKRQEGKGHQRSREMHSRALKDNICKKKNLSSSGKAYLGKASVHMKVLTPPQSQPNQH